MIALFASFLVSVSGAFIPMDDSDAIYESTAEYGQVYTINLAPGYKYTYKPTYPD